MTADSEPAMPLAAVLAELDRLALEAEEGLRAIEQGQLVDLGGLEAAIQAMCHAAQKLPPAEAPATVSRLNDLVALLDRLAAELVHRSDALGDDTEATARLAADAYGKGTGRDK